MNTSPDALYKNKDLIATRGYTPPHQIPPNTIYTLQEWRTLGWNPSSARTSEQELFIPCTSKQEADQHIPPTQKKTLQTITPAFSPSLFQLDRYMENAEIFYTQQPYHYDEKKFFWLWNDTKKAWERSDDIKMINAVEQKLSFYGATINKTIKCNYLEAIKRIGRNRPPKNIPPSCVQFRDILFNITTKKIREATPEYFITNPIPWKPSTSAETPLFDELFKQWVDDAYVPTLYEIIAYCCLPDFPIQIIFCLTGGGRNGKTTFQRILEKFIGRNNVCSVELDALAKPDNRFETMKLYKKLVCLMGETNWSHLSGTSRIKQVTGGDTISFEPKGKEGFSENSYTKFIISTNSLPTTEDLSDGWFRRWMIIDFPNEFPEGSDILKLVPDEEYERLATKVMSILPDLIERGSFTNQGTIAERKERFIAASNPLSVFLDKYCVRYAGLKVRTTDLFNVYTQYLVANKRRVVKWKEFKGSLLNEGLVSERMGYGGDRDWYVLSVSLRDGVDLQTDFGNHTAKKYELIQNPTKSTTFTTNSILKNTYRENDIESTGKSGRFGNSLISCVLCGLATPQTTYFNHPKGMICDLCHTNQLEKQEILKTFNEKLKTSQNVDYIHFMAHYPAEVHAWFLGIIQHKLHNGELMEIENNTVRAVFTTEL